MDKKVISSAKNLVRYFLNPYRGVLAFLLVIIPLSVICEELIPWYIARIINLINSDEKREIIFNVLLTDMMKLTLFILSSVVLDILFLLILQDKCLGPASISVRKELFSFILKKERKFWNTNTGGEVWDKIEMTRRIIAAYSSIGEILNFAYRSLCMICVTLFLLYKIYPLLALVFAVSGTITLFVFNHISKNVKEPSANLSTLTAKVAGSTVNLINNFFILKTFGTEEREHKRIYKKFNQVANSLRDVFWIRKKNFLALKMLSLSFECAMLMFAVYLWSIHKIATGDIVFIMSATVSFAGKLDSFGWLIPFLKSREGTLERNLQTFNTGTEISDIIKNKKLKISGGKIEIKNLSFGYSKDKNVINNINLMINPKEKVGIVGLSGGGKTTLLHLLLRLIETPENTIFIDNQDITKVTINSLYEAMAFIPQDTSLFHRTVLENLKYGTFNAKNKAIKVSSKRAFAEEFIKVLPNKYQTLVGDKGVKLSGGQRQRIAISRALLKDAPILLLDEATSALDSQSETFIEKAIEDVIQNKTVIVVAHRLSTLKNMDRIIILDNGKIIEDGKPEILLKKNSKFKQLWEIQKNVAV